MRDLIIFTTTRPERLRVLGWVKRELMLYADKKFNENPQWTGPAADDVHTQAGVGADSWWLRQIEQYIGWANTLGLDTLAGRQALFKGFTTYLGLLESVVRVHGAPPLGGYPSGDIHTKEEGTK